MPPTIRTFRNTDASALCRVWNAHFGDIGPDAQIDPLRLELSALAKPCFRSEDLLIAEDDDYIVGFLHLGRIPSADGSEALAEVASIAALCIIPCADEDAIATTLLASAESTLRARGVDRCQFKPMFPNCAFYLGQGPADSMIGATTSEQRTCGWLRGAGFEALAPTNQWELDLGPFQPPIDRVQIQIRRSSRVARASDEPHLPWRHACLLGHAELSSFQLLRTADQQPLGELLFWSVATELRPRPSSHLWLWPLAIGSEPQSADQIVFLLGECCRQFQGERIDAIRTVSPAQDTAVNNALARVGFGAVQSGIVFGKRISAGDG